MLKIHKHALSNESAKSIPFFQTYILSLSQLSLEDKTLENRKRMNFSFYINSKVSIQSFLRAYIRVSDVTNIKLIPKNDNFFTPHNVNIQSVFNGMVVEESYIYELNHFSLNDFCIKITPHKTDNYHLIECKLKPLEYLTAINLIQCFGGYFSLKTDFLNKELNKREKLLYIFKKVGHFKKSFKQEFYRLHTDSKESVFYDRIPRIRLKDLEPFYNARSSIIDKVNESNNFAKISAKYLEKNIAEQMNSKLNKQSDGESSSSGIGDEFKI